MYVVIWLEILLTTRVHLIVQYRCRDVNDRYLCTIRARSRCYNRSLLAGGLRSVPTTGRVLSLVPVKQERRVAESARVKVGDGHQDVRRRSRRFKEPLTGNRRGRRRVTHCSTADSLLISWSVRRRAVSIVVLVANWQTADFLLKR